MIGSNNFLGLTNHPKVKEASIESIKKMDKNIEIVLLDPKGEIFNQKKAIRMADSKYNLVLICGHYEGIDDRINKYIDYNISVGNYILTGGEIPAMVIMDVISRNISGFFGKKNPHLNDTFCYENYIEYPQFTKPLEFEGKKIPDILLSGNHGEIDKWRKDKTD